MVSPPEQRVNMVPTYRTAPIKLRFELEARDLEMGLSFHQRRSSIRASRVGPLVLVGGVMLAIFGPDSVGIWASPVLLVIGAFLSAFPLVLRRSARQQFESLPPAQHQVEYELSEEHLRVIDGRSEAEMPWDEVRGVGSDAHALYWWVRPQLIHVIPVRAFQSPEAMREVVAFMERKLPKGAARGRTGSGRRRFFLLTFGLWIVLVLMFVAIYHLVTQPVGG